MQPLKLYKEMLLIRRFEEKSSQLYGMGMIAGFCHLYSGEEAIAVGMHNIINKNDSTITAYRDHGHILVAGSDPKTIMAELMGKSTGCSKGKGGSMHMFDLEKKFYGGHGIVGAQVPIGTGMAFAAKYKEDNSITLAYFGDGALNQGQVYESFNMAALWKLPIIYIVENNGYAMGTSIKRHCSIDDLSKRGESFGIPGIKIDGMNIIEVMEKGKEAVDYVRAGNGPMLIEMQTYRYRGHSMSDPATYRSKEEVSNVRDNHDPINFYRNHILKNKLAKEEDLKSIEKEVKKIIEEAVEFAQNSPEPNEDELHTEVYI
ncbi:MAG: pyruvate dehydrogenase (acetyl-transferring) E1 component subunit alpha [Rickettsiales bacterium]|nr:pyruvate dehydrogenase (acetyl-transferring) E1 component subunit alpha [Rickettsiales bacterium]